MKLSNETLQQVRSAFDDHEEAKAVAAVKQTAFDLLMVQSCRSVGARAQTHGICMTCGEVFPKNQPCPGCAGNPEP